MFFLVSQIDTVKVKARDLRKPRPVALTDELNKKYANKVMHNVGLCIRVYDISAATDGVVHACQDGSYMAKVGKVANSSIDGLRISMEFFDDILVPASMLKPGTIYDKTAGLWVWQYEDEDTGEVNRLELEKDEPIRFRVEGETFIDAAPNSMSVGKEQKAPPFSLTCSIYDDGCGLLSWW